MNKKASNSRKAQEGGKPGASVWMFFFLACGCMFVLGVLVGRNAMPVRFDMEDLNKKLSMLQTSVLAGDEEDPAGSEKPFAEMTFEFYEKLRDDRIYSPSQDEEMPVRLIKPKFEKNLQATATLDRGDPEAAQNRKDINGETQRAIEPQASVEKFPSPGKTGGQKTKQEPEDRGGYAIQVISLRDKDKAEAVREKFKSRGYPAYTQQAFIEGRGNWFRVRIGPYNDKQRAQQDLFQMREAGVDAILLSTGSD